MDKLCSSRSVDVARVVLGCACDDDVRFDIVDFCCGNIAFDDGDDVGKESFEFCRILLLVVSAPLLRKICGEPDGVDSWLTVPFCCW